MANNSHECKLKTPKNWSPHEKTELLIEILIDERFTYAERVVGAHMIAYFHNSSNNWLFPSRKQCVEATGVQKGTVISATNKMERFGYMSVDKSDGGRNKRNTYHLKKRSEKVTVLDTQTVQKKHRGGPENGPVGVQKMDPHIPIEFIQRRKGSALPSPRNSEAAAEQVGIQKMDLPAEPTRSDTNRMSASTLLKSPTLRKMFSSDADRFRTDAEQRLSNDIVALPETVSSDLLNWMEPESDSYQKAVVAETNEKHSGLPIILAAWEASKKEKIA